MARWSEFYFPSWFHLERDDVVLLESGLQMVKLDPDPRLDFIAPPRCIRESPPVEQSPAWLFAAYFFAISLLLAVSAGLFWGLKVSLVVCTTLWVFGALFGSVDWVRKSRRSKHTCSLALVDWGSPV